MFQFKSNLSVLFFLLSILFVLGCKNNFKSGIRGKNNNDNTIVIGDNSVVNNIYSEKTKFASVDFLNEVSLDISLSYLVDKYGTPIESRDNYKKWSLENIELVVKHNIDSSIYAIIFNLKKGNPSTFNLPNKITKLYPSLPKFGVIRFKDIYEVNWDYINFDQRWNSRGMLRNNISASLSLGGFAFINYVFSSSEMGIFRNDDKNESEQFEELKANNSNYIITSILIEETNDHLTNIRLKDY